MKVEQRGQRSMDSMLAAVTVVGWWSVARMKVAWRSSEVELMGIACHTTHLTHPIDDDHR